MNLLSTLLVLVCLGLAGCSSLEVPGSAREFSNQPGGLPFFRVSSGIGGPRLAVREPGGGWTPGRPLKRLTPTDPPLSTTPGLAALVENAYRVDSYVFIEFKPNARVHGEPMPSRYFLQPGGFAYLVAPR